MGCRLRPSTGAAGYAWWWGGHSTWAWALVDSGGGSSLTFNRTGGLGVVRCRLSSMVVLVAASVAVVVVVEERSNVTTCNVGILLIFTRKITCDVHLSYLVWPCCR